MHAKKSLYGLRTPRAWFGRFASVVRAFGLFCSKKVHSVFWRQQGKMLLLVVYVDHIIIIGGDAQMIADLKYYLQKHFQIKDLRSLQYFLGIEVAMYRDYFLPEKVCLI